MTNRRTTPLNTTLHATDQLSSGPWRWVPEWYPQAGVILAWPHAQTDWVHCLQDAQQTYLELILAISQVELVWLIVPDTQTEQTFCQSWNAYIQAHSAPCASNVHTIILPYNDTWLRDTGPLTLIPQHPDSASGLKLLSFSFNGWGEKFAYNLDRTLGQRFTQTPVFQKTFPAKVTFEQLSLIAEGGNLETNGEGVILTQRPCLLHKNRPNELSPEQWQAVLNAHLGTDSVWWIDQGELVGDDTDGHIDTLVRFTSTNHLVYQQCDEHTYPHYEALQLMQEQLQRWTKSDDKRINNKPLSITPLPWPEPVYNDQGERLAATYANFLILNSRVILPVYGVPQDQLAQKRLQQCFPDREVIPVKANALVNQGGSIHCATMQVHLTK